MDNTEIFLSEVKQCFEDFVEKYFLDIGSAKKGERAGASKEYQSWKKDQVDNLRIQGKELGLSDQEVEEVIDTGIEYSAEYLRQFSSVK